MEFVESREMYEQKKVETKSFLQEKYPLDATLYLDPPDERVSVDEIREISVERVKLFRAFEIASVKMNKEASFKELAMEEMTKENLRCFMPLVKGYPDMEARRRDYLSHYMLRICYCRSEEYRKWFVAREMEFFKLKLSNLNLKEDVALFIKKNRLNYIPISEEEKASLSSELINSTLKYVNLDSINVFKVHFTEVLDLISKRRVYVKSGNAYVFQTDLYSVLSSIFKKNLIQELDYYAKNLFLFEKDQRISSLVRGLHTCYIGKDYSTDSAKQSVSKDNLDSLSNKSFPLCMREIHKTLRTTHHLRYNARLQYGLFLKGIGVSMEDSLKFWKENFTKKPNITPEVFEKQYAYSIRHSYGNEGKRANYTPHSCMKIINTTVGNGENHGCPFKHYDANSLKTALLGCNISTSDVLSISDYATRGHYQLACTKFFDVTHNLTNANGINHPNQYFEESQNLLKSKEAKNSKKCETSKTDYQFEPKWEDDIDLTNLSSIINDSESNQTSQ